MSHTNMRCWAAALLGRSVLLATAILFATGRATFAATIGLNFTGTTKSYSGVFVPDVMGAVGPDHIVETLNYSIAVYDKATGRLLRRYRAGNAGIEAYAEDYAFLIQGLLDLYEATFAIGHLQWALQLQEQLDADFWDPAHGGYFRTSGADASVLLRLKEDYDGAEPAPSSIVSTIADTDAAPRILLLIPLSLHVARGPSWLTVLTHASSKRSWRARRRP